MDRAFGFGLLALGVVFGHARRGGPEAESPQPKADVLTGHPMPRILIALFTLVLAFAARASAQYIDFSGQWVPIFHEDGPERLPGPELGDYLGLPITDAARLRADSYDADRISAVTEYQCRQHAGDYGMRGLANMRITADIDRSEEHTSEL